MAKKQIVWISGTEATVTILDGSAAGAEFKIDVTTQITGDLVTLGTVEIDGKGRLVKTPKAEIEGYAEHYEVWKAAEDASYNAPANVERRTISDLYARANRLANSQSENNVAGPRMIRIDADQKLAAWREKYPEAAKEEKKGKLLAEAEHQEDLASGALTYDSDGWLDKQEQQKRHDDFTARAADYRQQAATI
jgi:hypothetical protein